ncbi:DUF6083 domain-containing protein [Nocardia sp. NPDC058658]|uniref:DUF6083 domain-containing protein n=1 Tax=Nocardia sp. NPDC058658 TaxID=3346580 RepID=UPI00365E876D
MVYGAGAGAEERPVPLRTVACDFEDPTGQRWRVAGDGTAVNLGGANPTDECRITHFDVCPAKRAPEDGALLLGVWRGNRRDWMVRQNL